MFHCNSSSSLSLILFPLLPLLYSYEFLLLAQSSLSISQLILIDYSQISIYGNLLTSNLVGFFEASHAMILYQVYATVVTVVASSKSENFFTYFAFPEQIGPNSSWFLMYKCNFLEVLSNFLSNLLFIGWHASAEYPTLLIYFKASPVTCYLKASNLCFFNTCFKCYFITFMSCFISVIYWH